MNNKLFILPLLAAAVALPSCDNKEDQIFSDDASTRLEQAKKEYSELLTSEGGKWLMEYFSNGDEPGYTLGLEFSKDGSVNVSGNHKWLDNKYTEDRSLFELLADDGPVLSFNSYNDVFHQFSDPVNITGPDAPVDEDRDNEDIDETGYGHNGDYEFNVMYVSEKSDSVRLRGKKRGITHWLIRLPADTDMEQYLTDYKAKAESVFSSKFNRLLITDTNGEQFVLTDAYKGVMSVYPLDGDAITQTSKKNAIITDKGMRYMDTLSVHRADNKADMLKLTSFNLQADGTLLSPEGVRITCVSPVELLNIRTNTFRILPETITGKFKTAYDAAAEGVHEAYKNDKRPRELEYLQFTWQNVSNKWYATLYMRIGTGNARFYMNYTADKGEKVGFVNVTSSSDAKTYVKRVPTLGTLHEVISGAEYNVTTDTPLKPSLLKFTDASDANSSFVVEIQ